MPSSACNISAFYSGDPNNTGPTSSACADAALVFSPTPPSFATQLSHLPPSTLFPYTTLFRSLSNATADAGGTVKYAFYSLLSDCTAGTYAAPGGTSLGSKSVTNGSVPDSNSTGALNTAGTY